jgi:hypothetical protein
MDKYGIILILTRKSINISRQDAGDILGWLSWWILNKERKNRIAESWFVLKIEGEFQPIHNSAEPFSSVLGCYPTNFICFYGCGAITTSASEFVKRYLVFVTCNCRGKVEWMYSVVAEWEITYRSVTERMVFRSRHHTHYAVGIILTMLNRRYRYCPNSYLAILRNCLTQLSIVLLVKQIIPHVANTFAIFMEPEEPLPCWQESSSSLSSYLVRCLDQWILVERKLAEETEVLRGNMAQFHLDLTWPDLGWNPGRRCGKRVSDPARLLVAVMSQMDSS